MDLLELMKGIAVIIDDEIFIEDSNIQKIVKQIEAANIPIIKYSSIPSRHEIENFQNISFLILDWRLTEDDVTVLEIDSGVTIPNELLKDKVNENFEFLRRISDQHYNPLFIFTNENVDEIRERVYEEFKFSKDKPNNFLIQSKSDLVEDGDFIKNIEDWIKRNPSIYVLKKWESEYRKAKHILFTDFYKINELWPTVIWNTLSDDGGAVSQGMNEFIYRNLYSRVIPYSFDEDILTQHDVEKPTKEDLRRVLEGERFLSNERLDSEDVSTGDVFIIKNGDGQDYWINIRAQCDLVRHESGNPDLYLIKGKELIQNEKGKIDKVSFHNGEYLEKSNNSIIPFINGGKIIEFQFKEMSIKEWKEVKGCRIGRLLPPYITKVQQRYSLYIQRQGLVRIPKEAIFDKV